MKLNKIIVLILLLILCFSCSDNILPKVYDPDYFKNDSNFQEDYVELGTNKEFLLIRVPVEGPMAFGSPNDHIGLYKNRKLADEIVLGWIPMELITWSDNTITLKVLANRQKEYLDSWLKKSDSQRIGDFNIEYIY